MASLAVHITGIRDWRYETVVPFLETSNTKKMMLSSRTSKNANTLTLKGYAGFPKTGAGACHTVTRAGKQVIQDDCNAGNQVISTFEEAFASVAYVNTIDEPTRGMRVVTSSIFDGMDYSTVASTEISLKMINEHAPVLFADGTDPVFVEETEHVKLLAAVDNTCPAWALQRSCAGSVKITDADHADEFFIQEATVKLETITRDLPFERLLVSVFGTPLKAKYDGQNGVLTISGSATVEIYASVLSTAAYINAQSEPDLNSRVISFSVSDGVQRSNVRKSTVTIEQVNDNKPEVLFDMLVADISERAEGRDAAVIAAVPANLTLRDIDAGKPMIYSASVLWKVHGMSPKSFSRLALRRCPLNTTTPRLL
jgi:hypothetical protein